MRWLMFIAAAVAGALTVANNVHAAPLVHDLAGRHEALRWTPMVVGFGGAGAIVRRAEP